MIRKLRNKQYRGKHGLIICGEGIKIFFEFESQADEFIKRHKQGENHEKVLKEIWGIK
uniref:Uncharacterized protein n=1 Tax=viral metagenome TaxID=1070528 RepID=A0A6H1Z8E3_9ZZZZ